MAFKRGISFWCYMYNYRSGKMDMESMIAEASHLGAYGIELLPNMHHICDYPNYTRADIDHWFELMDKYHTKPVCNAAMIVCKPFFHGVDARRFPNAHIGATHEEMVELMMHEIKLSHDFGFTFMRHPFNTGVSMKAIEETLPYAEEMNVNLGLEIHLPYQINGPEVADQVDMIERTGTRHACLIPDFGIFADRIASQYRKRILQKGADPEIIAQVDADLAAHKDMGEVAEELKGKTSNTADLEYIGYASQFYANDPEELKKYGKYIKHVHTKFMDMDESNSDTMLDYNRIMKVLKDISYDGYLMSEYEGQRLHEPGDGSEEVEQTRRQHNMLKKIIGEIE